ncbi:hypothetical protein E4099_29110 [Streptomyces palmae]|uniref:Secreted protein n=1 Tax=Streptomyces palmae TaxID=1701085 RepID=A0A4Z0G6V7_9ACTN|nr:hypothetical protein E4099_29110 [Streptomyces palmae]
MVRGLAVAAGAAAVVGAVLMRSWDRAAGKRVTELAKERTREEWRTEERIAELETEVEEGRELREAFTAKLRAKRAELARLRNEHAELLRRYATAESERARALETGRVLAISASDAEAPESDADAPESGTAALPAEGAGALAGDAYEPLDPELFRRAAAALHLLGREKRQAEPAEQPAQAEPAEQPVEAGGADSGAGGTVPGPRPEMARVSRGEPVGAGSDVRVSRGEPVAVRSDVRVSQGESAAVRSDVRASHPEPTAEDASHQGRDSLMHGRNAASAVVPYAAARRAAARAEGSFDFFGTQKKRPQLATRHPEPKPEPLTLTAEEDLADVVGAEALAEQSERRAGGEVIDLTAHDETEQIDVAELRSAIS